MGRSSDAKDRLLTTASRLVHEAGYNAVSVADICAEAGLKKGSFYHFFKSKQDLVLTALDCFGQRLITDLDQAIERGVSVTEHLEGLFESMYQSHRESLNSAEARMCGCPIGNIASEMAHRDPQFQEKIQSIFSDWQTRLQVLLQRADERRELVVADPALAAESLVAYLQGVLLLAKASNDPNVFRRLAKGAIALAQTPASDLEVQRRSHPVEVSSN